jgi:hypothetical protein
MLARPLQFVLLGCLLATGVAPAYAQAGIYTCIDAKGRRLTSDRPIIDCLDREQKELNSNGTVRRLVGPSLSVTERAALEERERKVAEDRQRQAEEKRAQKALMLRYPTQAAHEVEREKALKLVQEVVATGQRRIVELQEQRKKLDVEAEFYKTPAQYPHKLKRQIEENEQQLAGQLRFMASQDEEKARINKRFDEELARLKILWAQAASATAGAPPAAPPAAGAAPAATTASGAAPAVRRKP